MKTFIISFLILTITLISCGGDNDLTNELVISKVAIDELLNDYNNCQSLRKENTNCKDFTAKAISQYFGINDLRKEDRYIDYNEIYDYVSSSNNWDELGRASNQEILDKAQDLVNNQTPVIAINTEDKHKLTILIIEGKQTKSSKWDLKVPNSAAFFPSNGPEAFVNKTMNYAWSSPEGIKLFVRN